MWKVEHCLLPSSLYTARDTSRGLCVIHRRDEAVESNVEKLSFTSSTSLYIIPKFHCARSFFLSLSLARIFIDFQSRAALIYMYIQLGIIIYRGNRRTAIVCLLSFRAQRIPPPAGYTISSSFTSTLILIIGHSLAVCRLHLLFYVYMRVFFPSAAQLCAGYLHYFPNANKCKRLLFFVVY